MPCRECGSAISSTLAAELLDLRERGVAHARPRRARAPAPPSPGRRSAGRRAARRVGSCTPPSMPSEVESHGSRPCRWLQQDRGVGHVARERAALVERGGEGDHPVAADGAVGGLQPDDPAQRSPAGGSSRRCRCRSPRARCRRPPLRRCRPTSRPARGCGPTGSGPGPKPEFSFDEPIANSSWFVLPSTWMPASAGSRRSWPCTAGGSPRGCASRPCSARPSRRRGP